MLKSDRERDIIMKMEMLESVISQLYKSYAKKFPLDDQFWIQLSKEEEEHAKWVKKLGKQSKQTNQLFSQNRFKINAIQTTIQYIQKKIKQAVTETSITERDAYHVAWDIENGLLEKEFFKNFKSDQKDLKDVLNKLIHDTENHRNRIGLKKNMDNVN